jgi:DNA repair protein RadC
VDDVFSWKPARAGRLRPSLVLLIQRPAFSAPCCVAAFYAQEIMIRSDSMKPIQIIQLKQVFVGEWPGGAVTLRNPNDAYEVLKDLIEFDREVSVVLMLDTKNKPIGLHFISMGTLNSTLVSPREVFKAAILNNASHIIFAHNHPSGDPTPSQEDVTMTQRLCEAGKILAIEVMDSLVIGHNRFVSLREQGLM